jgi:DNA-binding transcriptional regulator YiaG
MKTKGGDLNHVLEARKRCGMTKAGFAAALRVSYYAVLRWESGERPRRYISMCLEHAPGIFDAPEVSDPVVFVRACQAQLGLTNIELARRLRVTKGAVSHWRHGRAPVSRAVILLLHFWTQHDSNDISGGHLKEENP